MISAKVVRKLTELVDTMEYDGLYEMRIRVRRMSNFSADVYISKNVLEIEDGESAEFQRIK